MSTSAHGTDYLAVILVGVGSCWGRSPNKEMAIKNCLRAYKQDAGSIFKIAKGDEVIVNVIDVAPHDEVSWDNRGIWVGDQKLERKIEQVHRSVP
jgi:hypothetical protein